MNIPFYFFSNTKFLDFHVINRPKDSTYMKECENIMTSLDYLTFKSPFIVYKQTINNITYIGASFFLRELNGVSDNYFFTERNNGKTPTQITIILVLKKDNKIIFNKQLLSFIVKKVFQHEWNKTKETEVTSIRVKIPHMTFEQANKRYLIKKSKFLDIDFMFNRFNSEININKNNLLFYLKKRKINRELEYTYNNLSIKK